MSYPDENLVGLPDVLAESKEQLVAYLPHCRVRINGVLGVSALVPSEIWSTGFQISDVNFANLPSSGQVNAIAGQIEAWFNNSDTNLHDNAFVTELIISAINSAGHVRTNPDGSFMQIRHALSESGYAGSPYRDYPVSSVVTLHTPRAGASGRGRMYLPVPADVVDETGHHTSSAALSRAISTGAMLSDVNGYLASGSYQGAVVVASRAGLLSPVTAVKVGTVHDTQRRRRDALVEDYQVYEF